MRYKNFLRNPLTRFSGLLIFSHQIFPLLRIPAWSLRFRRAWWEGGVARRWSCEATKGGRFPFGGACRFRPFQIRHFKFITSNKRIPNLLEYLWKGITWRCRYGASKVVFNRLRGSCALIRDKAKPFVRRCRKAAGLLWERWPSCRRIYFSVWGAFCSLSEGSDAYVGVP